MTSLTLPKIIPILDAKCFASLTAVGRWLYNKGLDKHAIEIGTHRGKSAKDFLLGWKGEHYWCVDHWQKYDPTDPASQGDREKDFEKAVETLAPFKDRVTIMREESVTAAQKFNDNFFDWVYIDACHRFNAVLEDLRTWWPKIHLGGILAGDDFICRGEALHGWGQEVQPAVWTFAREMNIQTVDIGIMRKKPYLFIIQKVER